MAVRTASTPNIVGTPSAVSQNQQGFSLRTRLQSAEEIGSTIKRALDSNAPALVEVPITRDVSIAAAEVVGWWDFPVLPTAPDAVKADYQAGYAAEQHRRSATDAELVEPVSALVKK
jgi:hypothetical protein